ncbi:DUF3558 family protein [Corynebacterium uterequi]|uniref:DUF3558 family protein n=1 Tax=Corynebacterium uterequi TaxID=1072256 RepID=A0A0G3HKN7_9CORY|nr:DUF3558 family protein [Corynebacterium uterequi]AKK11662.1 hypothetical protein CUTER_08385 [Corynebacterium uterequi]
MTAPMTMPRPGSTASWQQGRRLRRRVFGVLLAASLLPLSSCSNASYTRVTNTELPPGFYLSGEFVELGPRDPNAPDPEWIDPCNEIPEEILEDIGMKRGTRSGGTSFGMNGCSGPVSKKLTDGKEYPVSRIVQSMTAGPTLNQQFLAHPEFTSDDFLEDVPGVLVLRNEEECGLSVDTKRGLFVVNASSRLGVFSGDELCEVATKSFYRLYNELREQK